jgi:alkylresorcinol/alkylpyrone synthase
MPRIIATASSLPSTYYEQELLAQTLENYIASLELPFEGLWLVRDIFKNAKVQGRHFAIPLDSFYEPPDFGEGHRLMVEKRNELCAGALSRLFEKSGLAPSDIRHIASVTSVMSIPSVDAEMMNRFGFRKDLKRVPILGLGCQAGAAGISRVADYLRGHPREAAILLGVEMGSSIWAGPLQRDLAHLLKHLQRDSAVYSTLISQIVASSLFGDGAAALLMVGDEHPLATKAGPRVVDTRSFFVPGTVGLMGMNMEDAGPRNVLGVEVPEMASRTFAEGLAGLLSEHALSVPRIAHWFIHPGGPKVLQEIQSAAQLPDSALAPSWGVLNEVGNLSSATVLYMLGQHSGAQAGDVGLLTAMGPGFSEELVLLQW